MKNDGNKGSHHSTAPFVAGIIALLLAASGNAVQTAMGPSGATGPTPPPPGAPGGSTGMGSARGLEKAKASAAKPDRDSIMKVTTDARDRGDTVKIQRTDSAKKARSDAALKQAVKARSAAGGADAGGSM